MDTAADWPRAAWEIEVHACAVQEGGQEWQEFKFGKGQDSVNNCPTSYSSKPYVYIGEGHHVHHTLAVHAYIPRRRVIQVALLPRGHQPGSCQI